MEEAGNAIEHTCPSIVPMSNVKSILMDKHKVVIKICASRYLDLNQCVSNKANVDNGIDELSISEMNYVSP